MGDRVHAHGFYRGKVFHRRLISPKYTFNYRVFNLLVDIDRLDELDRSLKLLSCNRFNLFSFYSADHLFGVGRTQTKNTPLRAQVEAGLRAHGIELNGGRIRLFCYPRVLGFVFNPLSVWYCEDDNGQLVAILCEVRNTFKEKHIYLLRAVDGGSLDWKAIHHHPKRFHVSPFLPVEGGYEFRFNKPGGQLDVGIVWSNEGERSMIATQRMHRVPMNDWNLLKTFFLVPLMTFKVVFAIHWQALKIWARGGRFHKKPNPPHKEISSDV